MPHSPSFNLSRILQETSVRHIEYHESLGSTSGLAVELLQDLLPMAPALVLTSQQTAGKGRGNHRWWSTTGALTCSLVLESASLHLPPDRLPLVSLATGAAVRTVLQSVAPGQLFQIKWPNDVMAHGIKISGILTEQHTTSGQSALIIGIGINVNNSLSGAPDDIRTTATSLFDLTGQTFDLTELLVLLLNEVESGLRQAAECEQALLSDITRNSLLTGMNVCIQSGEQQLQGYCSGIDVDGALLVATDRGLRRVTSGTVLHWASSEAP